MSYVYISEARLRRGGVIVAEANLESLPEAALKKAVEQKVIKKKNERRSKEAQVEGDENEG